MHCDSAERKTPILAVVHALKTRAVAVFRKHVLEQNAQRDFAHMARIQGWGKLQLFPITSQKFKLFFQLVFNGMDKV